MYLTCAVPTFTSSSLPNPCYIAPPNRSMEQNPEPPPDAWVFEPWMVDFDTPSPPPSPPPSPLPSPLPTEEDAPPAEEAAPPAAPKVIKPWKIVKPFYKEHLTSLYSCIPPALTPPEGWDEYNHKDRGRRYGSSHMPSNQKQLKLICRGVDFIGPLQKHPQPVRTWLQFPDELSFSRDQVQPLSKLGRHPGCCARQCGTGCGKRL